MLAAAAHKLYPKSKLLVGHSLGYGYYYTFGNGNKICDENISLIEKEMQKMVQQDIPIETETISYNEAVCLFEKLGLEKTRKQLNFIAPPRVKINSIEDLKDLNFGTLFLSTYE